MRLGWLPQKDLKIQETDGGISGQKEHDFAVFVHGSIWS